MASTIADLPDGREARPPSGRERLRRRGEEILEEILDGPALAVVPLLVLVASAFWAPALAIGALAAIVVAISFVLGRTSVGLAATWAIFLFVSPPRYRFGPLGFTPAIVIGLALLVLWASSRVVGTMRPRPVSPAIRALQVLTVVWLFTYAFGMTRSLLPAQLDVSDRRVIILASSVGVALYISESLRSPNQVRALLAVVCAAAGFMAFVGVFEFLSGVDLSDSLRIPGFAVREKLATAQAVRFGIKRVAGTTTHPIELATVSMMVVPITLHFAWTARRQAVRVAALATAVLLVMAALVSVSRTAVVAFAVLALFLLPGYSSTRRFQTYLGIGVLAVLGAVLVPELYDALRGLVEGFMGSRGTESASDVTLRTEDYSVVRDMVLQRPWFGSGFSTHIAFATDNQYLAMLIETGVVGTAAFVGMIVVVLHRARALWKRSTEPLVADLAHSLRASIWVGVIALALYDGLAFTIHNALLFALIGCVGALDSYHRAKQTAGPLLAPAGLAA